MQIGACEKANDLAVCVCDGVMIFLIYDDWVVGVYAKFGKKATINKILYSEEAYLEGYTFNPALHSTLKGVDNPPFHCEIRRTGCYSTS